MSDGSGPRAPEDGSPRRRRGPGQEAGVEGARSRPPATGQAGLGEWLGWAVLASLLAAVLAAAFLFDRAGRPSLVGDEATYAMQAASLAFDFDLAYTRGDYDRFVAQWGGPPDGVILQSRDGGAHITYGKPFLYALVVAPFVRFSPIRGPLVANALLLAAAAVLSARTLRLRLGGSAPLWVAVLVFASVSFAYVFWVHSDLFLLAATAAGFAVAYGGDQPLTAGEGAGPSRVRDLPQVYGGEQVVSERRLFARWCLAGALLAVAAAYRPLYVLLLLPAAFAAPRERRRAAWGGLAAGAGALLLATSLVQWASGGSWSGYAGERQGFYQRTGYPEVDFPASSWESTIRQWGNTSWVQPGAFDPYLDPRLWSWNTLYFLAGRDIGVLPYFLPLVLGFYAYRGDRGRWLIPLAVAVAVAGFFLVRPFNFYGGGGAIGNRYFLPLYPALWFLAARPVRAAPALVVAALAAPFLWPLWAHPSAFPIGEDGRYRHVSEVARHLLPYETTQSHIPGGQDVSEDGLWLKLLNHNLYRTAAGLRLVGSGQGELLVGSPVPLSGLSLELDHQAPTHLLANGQDLRPTVFHPDGSIVFDIALDKPRAVHPMWWSRQSYYLYGLALQLPNAKAVPIGLRVIRGRNPATRIEIKPSRGEDPLE